MEYVAAALLGFAGGTLGGLVGVGGGVLFVPALAIFLDQSQIRAEATSLLAIVFVALVGAWRQQGYGNVRVRDGLLVGALSPLGVAAGVVISNAVPERALELLFAALALVFAAQLSAPSPGDPSPPSAQLGQGHETDCTRGKRSERGPPQPQRALSLWPARVSEWALLGPCPIQPPVRQLRCSLELAEAPCAGQSRAVCLRAVELVALTGIPRLRLQCDQAGV